MNCKKYIVQITSGRGPQECSWVAAQAYREFIREANLKSFEYEVLSQIDGQLPGTIRSVFIEIIKADADFINKWLGTIQWIGPSPYRQYHKRKNWFIGIFLLDSIDYFVFDEKAVTFQTIRSSGAGGQNVNKVESAVRATHKTTGLQVLVMCTRSQLQNKKLALERLKVKCREKHFEKIEENASREWLNQMTIERGNASRIYEGSKFKLVH